MLIDPVSDLLTWGLEAFPGVYKNTKEGQDGWPSPAGARSTTHTVSGCLIGVWSGSGLMLTLLAQ